MKKNPLAQVADKFGGKEKLAGVVADLVENVGLTKDGETKEERKKRFATTSNRKLMRLQATLTEVKDKWGSREKLAESYLALVKRTKDADYKKALLAYPPSRLLDLFRAAERRAKRAKAA